MVNKTAVQWLFEEYKKREIATDEIVELFVKAEQREMEQVKWFIQVGYYAHSQGHQKTDELYEYWINNFKSE